MVTNNLTLVLIVIEQRADKSKLKYELNKERLSRSHTDLLWLSVSALLPCLMRFAPKESDSGEKVQTGRGESGAEKVGKAGVDA